MLGYIPVIEICDPGIKQDIKKKGEIENGEIIPVIAETNRILHCAVDPENPERFDQEVQEQ